MITSIIKELLVTKIAECNEIYSQTLIDGEYESSNIASFSEKLGSISGNTNLNHTRYTHLNKLWTSLSLTMKI